jgi:ADP-dependent NAD(P)H-hydrate dehydratase / NAD(P)H-hydrate epimerase
VKVVTTAEMIELEHRSDAAGVPPNVLMEHAGLAIARHIHRLVGNVAGRDIVVLAGPGNNGGDGLVAARHLRDWGARVCVYLPVKRKDSDKNLHLVKERIIRIVLADDDKKYAVLRNALSSADVVIDAIFGTGRLRPISGAIKDILNRVRDEKKARPSMRIVAVDLPSGVDSDSGAADPSTLAADMTITLGYPKIGLFYSPGSELIGELVIADIGIPSSLGKNIATELITADWIRATLPKRPENAHKGTFGKVLVCAGSMQYIGAAYLACEAAMRVGAGLVTLATAQSLQPILAAKLTESTYAPLPEAEDGYISSKASRTIHEKLADYNVLLIGCGLSQHPSVINFVRDVLLNMPPSLKPKIVIDADALNALAQTPDWWKKLKRDAILTPHPGEMSRLSNLSMNEIAQDRLDAARGCAAKWNKTVILKGANSIIASPDGMSRINAAANAGLASAGTGDVLAGTIAGLLAQGLSYTEAAACGAYLHTAAADMVSSELGDAGMIASDLLPALPKVIKNIKEG